MSIELKQSYDTTMKQIEQIDKLISKLLNSDNEESLLRNSHEVHKLIGIKEQLTRTATNLSKEISIQNSKTAKENEERQKDLERDTKIALGLYNPTEEFANKLTSYLNNEGINLIMNHISKYQFIKTDGVGHELSIRKHFMYDYTTNPYQTLNDDFVKVVADSYIRYVTKEIKTIYSENERLRGKHNPYDIIGDIRIYISTEKIVVDLHEIKITGLEIIIQ